MGGGPGIFTLPPLLSFLLIGFVIPENQRSLFSSPPGRISAAWRAVCSRVNNYSSSSAQAFPVLNLIGLC